MRSWIASGHFPEEMKVNLCTERQRRRLKCLHRPMEGAGRPLRHLEAAAWTAEGITAAFKSTATQAAVSMRDVYRASYALFMGTERGPRLAPILGQLQSTRNS